MYDAIVVAARHCDEIALKHKNTEKQPLIPLSHSSNKQLEDIYPVLTSGEEGDDEEDSNESDLFKFATSSQVFNKEWNGIMHRIYE